MFVVLRIEVYDASIKRKFETIMTSQAFGKMYQVEQYRNDLAAYFRLKGVAEAEIILTIQEVPTL